MTHVLLDANVIISDFWLEGTSSRRLLAWAAAGKVQLHVPQVVIDEAVKHYRIELEKTSAALRKASRLDPDLRSVPEIDVEYKTEHYRNHLLEILRNANTKLSMPSISHEELAKRAVYRRKPFKTGGAGYQDALIWELVLQIARAGEEIVLVSNNSRDFGGDREGGLDPSLEHEIVEDGLGERVTRLASIAAVNTIHLPRDEELEEELKARLSESPSSLLYETMRAIEGLVASGGVLSGYGEIADAGSTDVDFLSIDSVELQAINQEDGGCYATIGAKGRADISFPMFAMEAWDDDAVSFSQLEDESDLGIAERDVEFELILTAEFDPAKDRFSDYEVAWVGYG
jgi:predicted nucleic acid-binding protein